jgi:hypothetical protein
MGRGGDVVVEGRAGGTLRPILVLVRVLVLVAAATQGEAEQQEDPNVPHDRRHGCTSAGCYIHAISTGTLLTAGGLAATV